MKKSLFVLPLATLALLSEPLASTFVSANSNPRIQLYSLSKSHRQTKLHYKKSLTVKKTLFFSKRLHYNGKTYYYIASQHAYTNQQGYNAANKFDQNLAKKEAKKFNQASKSNSKPSKHTTPKQDKIVNGQDLETTNIVDINAYAKKFIETTLNSINNLRQSKGLNTVSMTPTLNNIAQQRANLEITKGDNIGHYDANGQAYVDELAVQNNLYSSYADAEQHMAENIATDDIDGNPINDANFLMNDFIMEGPDNGDGNEHGHYENLVDPTHTNVGIGVKLSKHNTSAVLVLDFQSQGKSNMVM